MLSNVKNIFVSLILLFVCSAEAKTAQKHQKTSPPAPVLTEVPLVFSERSGNSKVTWLSNKTILFKGSANSDKAEPLKFFIYDVETLKLYPTDLAADLARTSLDKIDVECVAKNSERVPVLWLRSISKFFPNKNSFDAVYTGYVFNETKRAFSQYGSISIKGLDGLRPHYPAEYPCKDKTEELFSLDSNDLFIGNGIYKVKVQLRLNDFTKAPYDWYYVNYETKKSKSIVGLSMLTFPYYFGDFLAINENRCVLVFKIYRYTQEPPLDLDYREYEKFPLEQRPAILTLCSAGE